ncbi:hypothetical protein [Pseudomonas putida]|uniref:hypothetical protein n=1 Tax=Pseudomonas putida TaxID=303 RepID=UPI00186596EC|nr:hypothetical protein [Pseudomonas putida]
MTGVDELGKVARSVRGVTRLAKRLPGVNVVDAGAAAIDVAMNATSQDEKAEGYGGAAGSLAGTLAGAAAGAAIGSVVPVIGTAVGGAIGAVLGGMGGESLGGWLGKRWFGDDQAEAGESTEREEKPAAAKAEPAVSLPAAQTPVPVVTTVVQRREPVAKPVSIPSVPALGETVRTVAAPAEPTVSYDPRDPGSKDPYLLPSLTASRVRFPGADLVPPPAQPEPVAEPDPALRAPPKLGTTVQTVATPAPAELAVSYDPSEPGAKDPYLLPALTANKVRFPGASLVRPPAQPEPVADPAPALQAPPKLGTTVQAVATPAPAEPAVSYDPSEPDAKDPYLLPALAANKVRFPGAPLVRPPAQPEPVAEPALALQAPPKLGTTVQAVATPAAPAVSYDPSVPGAKDPYLLPALTANKVRFPGAGLVPPKAQPQPAPETPPPQAIPQPATLPAGFGDVVRAMASKSAPTVPRMPELAQPPKAAAPALAPAPKVDQEFSFSPTIKIDVQGDVKDPSQVVREIESPLRQLFEAWQREASARMSSAQLYDQPHV